MYQFTYYLGIRPSSELCIKFTQCVELFLSLKLLVGVPRSTNKLECHTLSGVRGYIFCVFAASFHIWGHSSPSSVSARGGRGAEMD